MAHTILLLSAEHGSAKSTITRFLVSLIDPSPSPPRKAPRDAEAWVTSASASWVVALENISGVIPLWLSDCLCRASTGDGDVRRQLYTDSDVAVFAFRRIVVINGIDVTVTQGDLADRLLRIGLPRIGDNRKTDEEIAVDWRREQPAIFGALLTLAAKVHQRMRTIAVPRLPRMADYAKVLAAVDEIHQTQGLAHYREQCKRIAADTLDAPLIAEIVGRRYECADATSAAILADIEDKLRKEAKQRDDHSDWRAPKGWPAGAREVTNQLTRTAPALRAQGWTVDNDDGQNKTGIIRWTLLPPAGSEKAGNSSPPDPPNPPEADNDWSDGLWEGGEDDLEDEDDNPPDPRSNPPNPPDPPDCTPLTCESGEAGQAGQEYTASLADDKNLCDCGTELQSEESKHRGNCTRCFLRSKREAHT